MNSTAIHSPVPKLIFSAGILAVASLLPAQPREVPPAGDPPPGDAFVTWGPVQRTLRYDYRLMNPNSDAVTDVDVYVPLPLESPRQVIHYLRLPRPDDQERIITDRHGQRLVHYRFESLEPGQSVDLGYVAGLTLKSIRWDVSKPSAAQKAPQLTLAQRELYLKAETNYSMDSEIMRRTTASLVQDAATDCEKLVKIHDYVISSIRYVRDNTWDPAATVLARGTGSCSEYNYVLSGLCRLAGLPTRCVGGTFNAHSDLPATDTVFHRWTEVFLAEFGWFPADCSLDANPIRGSRSHFGRNYGNVVVWCQQAGGEDDTLGLDYRAKAHVRGNNPGIFEDHSTRWFVFHPQQEVESACGWFLGASGPAPEPDLLECALLHWSDASLENRLRLIRALADSGRNVCLRRAAGLPEADQVREDCLRDLCLSSELADTLLKESGDPQGFRNWFRDREPNLVPCGEGKFKLAGRAEKEKPRQSSASSPEIWKGLVSDVVNSWLESFNSTPNRSVAIMPVTDQSLAGLATEKATILAAIKERVSREPGFTLVDEDRFDRWMAEQGPGRGQYWILANGESGGPAGQPVPDIVVVPVCITSRVDDSVLYHLELKSLDLHRSEYTPKVAEVRRSTGTKSPPDVGILVGGGDTVLARWEHDMVSRNGYGWPLAGVKPILESADVALCNLECCVSLAGTPIDKGEHCPFFYRARPEMLTCLTQAGIDVVTGANNHGGDYGPASLADTIRWCGKAGLVCVGIGNSAGEAEQPRLVRIGPLRVGIAGMDTTKSCYAAKQDRPGNSFVDEEGDLSLFTQKIKRAAEWADGRCDLLLLTVHWGENWVRETQPVHREMARIAFAHGVDAILGHSAHRLQGIEVIEGKPVVYDMGNLLFDCELSAEGRSSALFRLHLTKGGVTTIEVIPVQALNGRSIVARSEDAADTLAEMRSLCSVLGTDLALEEDLEGRPLGVVRIAKPQATSRKEPASDAACQTPAPRETIPPAVAETFLDTEIPGDARKLDPPVRLAPGVELVAWRMPAEAEEGGILQIATWWRVTGPVAPNAMPAFHICPGGETPRRGTPWYTRHDAADWTVPLWRVGPARLIEDLYPARLAGLPAGTCRVDAMIIDTTRPEGDGRLAEPCCLGRVEIVPRAEAGTLSVPGK